MLRNLTILALVVLVASAANTTNGTNGTAASNSTSNSTYPQTGCSATSSQCTNYLGLDFCCAQLSLKSTNATNGTNTASTYMCAPRSLLTSGTYTISGKTYQAQCTYGVFTTVSAIAVGLIGAVTAML